MLDTLTFIVPVRNDASRLQRCLDAIAANRSMTRMDVVVVDNGSSDNSAEVARNAGASVLRLPGITVAHARNAASAEATGSLLAFVDADHLIADNWVASAVAMFRDPNVDAAGAPYSSPRDANWVQRAYARFRPVISSVQETDWLGSGNLVIRRHVFDAVGGFDPSLEACEDVDLCTRLRQRGFRLVADPRLRSVHLGDPRTLRALFLGELWRGRNNLKVTLRGPVTWRTLPSLLIPAIDLACLGLMPLAPWLRWWPLYGALAVVAGVVLLRVIRMTLGRPYDGWMAMAGAIAVAAVYEVARALALVLRATHKTRRELAGERAVA